MYDINKSLSHAASAKRNPFDNLHDLDHWSPRLANQLAAGEGLFLEEAHWAVIYCLRERYREDGEHWTARKLTREMARDFAEQGGRRYLYQLFPHGPLAQACRLAGLPLPEGTLNKSFGSVH